MQDWKKKINERYVILLSEKAPFFLRTDYTIEEFANDLATNRSYASRFVNEVLGMSFPTLLNKLRIAYFIRMKNENPRKTITRLATEAGFSNVYSFRRAFYREYGITPKEYFKKHSLQDK